MSATEILREMGDLVGLVNAFKGETVLVMDLERLKRVFQLLQQAETDGIIGRWAIGGGIATVLYTEPFTTKDLDVFTQLPVGASGFIGFGEVYPFFLARGAKIEKQFLDINGIKTEFIHPASSLEEEAIDQAIEHDVGGMGVRVFTAEHLAAIALRVNRLQDQIKVERLRHAGALNEDKLNDILKRHGIIPASS